MVGGAPAERIAFNVIRAFDVGGGEVTFLPNRPTHSPKPITQQTAIAEMGIRSTKSTALRWPVFGSASAHKVEWTRPALLAAPALRRFRSPGH